MKQDLYSVSSINRYLKSLFDNDFVLRGLRIKGEISNLKRYPSGHVYFTLKDEESSLKAVMFADYTKYMPSSLKDGDEVIATGRISVYPARGEYQLYAEVIELFGQGNQLLELEMLKKKLQAEGLFDESHKRSINIYPRAIGVISAQGSAALADIRTNLLRRFPCVEVFLFPSLVQGEGAPKDLLRALKEAENSPIDTLIIGRGGGASEDLSAFNDETLIRAAYDCPIPIISAVGHEIDTTLLDYVADKRASTPTGAAELAVVDKREIIETLDRADNEMLDTLTQRVHNYKSKLDSLSNRPLFNHPETIYKEHIESLENVSKTLKTHIDHILQMKRQNLLGKRDELEAISPKRVLERGFSIASDMDGNVITSLKDISVNQLVKTQFRDGAVTSRIIEKEK